MFELTGALTYILPTMVRIIVLTFLLGLTPLLQIVLLVTKAVGDMLGVRGIADEMIRVNGYPFLERDDHAFNTTGKPSANTQISGPIRSIFLKYQTSCAKISTRFLRRG